MQVRLEATLRREEDAASSFDRPNDCARLAVVRREKKTETSSFVAMSASFSSLDLMEKDALMARGGDRGRGGDDIVQKAFGGSRFRQIPRAIFAKLTLPVILVLGVIWYVVTIHCSPYDRVGVVNADP